MDGGAGRWYGSAPQTKIGPADAENVNRACRPDGVSNMTQSTPPLKAIPTRYAGYHFRSRLEARWAVFFDSLGKPWQYEPQGFELPSGNYLPDFRVEEWYSSSPEWFEVKGRKPTQKEWVLLSELCRNTQMWGSFLGDIPDFALADSTPLGARMPFGYHPPWNSRGQATTNRTGMQVVPGVDMSALRAALAAARSARFEHGHSGAS